MKKLFFLIALILACNIQAQAPMNDFNVNFIANDDGITDGYEVYFWAGPDTMAADTVDLGNFTRVGYYSHDSLAAIYGQNLEAVDIYPSPLNGEYLVAALRAHRRVIYNGSPLEIYSAFTFSPAYQKGDVRLPQVVQLPFISE